MVKKFHLNIEIDAEIPYFYDRAEGYWDLKATETLLWLWAICWVFAQHYAAKTENLTEL